VAALALPAGAQAADSTSVVTGTVATELSLGVTTPAALAFSHAAPATTSSVAGVTSTQTLWTLSISDNAGTGGANPAKMLKDSRHRSRRGRNTAGKRSAVVSGRRDPRRPERDTGHGRHRHPGGHEDRDLLPGARRHGERDRR
jgi:hypothetical protein